MPKNWTGPPSILPDIWCTYKLTGGNLLTITVDYQAEEIPNEVLAALDEVAF